ncbi:MAG: LysR family transcriptional regulator [Eubacteriales bacterium]|nr:LysR family transcriptional regulator [Eubacteriales bacterium]
MDIENIKTFLVLANTKNFTRTANQLFVAQSTITNRINELEKEIGVSLFSRTNRSVELTPEGEHFRIYADKVVDLTNSSLSELSSLHKYKNQLRIGASDSIYEGHLAPIILKHQKNNPDDSLKITIGLSSHLLEQLQNDILDVVFTYLPLKKAHYHCQLYHQDSLVLVTDIQNTTYKNGITHDALLSVNYVMCNFALQDVGQFIRHLFPKYHQFALEIDDCSKVIPFLLGCDTYTFLPADMAAPFVANHKLQIIPLLDLQTPMINSYIIGNSAKKELWQTIFLAEQNSVCSDLVSCLVDETYRKFKEFSIK